MRRYSISMADLKKNKEDILALWERNFTQVPENRYPWIYEENPAGPAACWIAKDLTNNEVVGETALFPRRISINGKICIVGIAGDFAVDKEHRGLGPAMPLQKAAISHCRDKNFFLLYGFPNKKSASILLRAGYKRLGDVFRMTKPLRSQYHLKKHFDAPVLTRALSKPIDFAIRLITKNQYKNNTRYTFEVPSLFDERFDDLWKRASTRFAIIGERSSSYLNWRYKRSPYNAYSIFALISNGGNSLLGFIVYQTAQNKTNIVDLLSLDLEKTFDSLMSEFINFSSRISVDSISICYAGSQAFVKKITEYGFSIRDRDEKIVIYTQADAPLHDFLSQEDNWYLMQGDNDI